MPTVTILGAKGGVGVSLIATNLAREMARRMSVILVDLHTTGACDDLLLDLPVERGWQHLLKVAHELSREHLKRVLRRHLSGAQLLGSTGSPNSTQLRRLPALLESLEGFAEWRVIDVSAADQSLLQVACRAADQVLLTTTPDPLSLRCAVRLREHLSEQGVKQALIVNQLSRHHPGAADAIAESLRLPLAAAVNRDPAGAGYQVNIGQQPERGRAGGLAEAGENLAGWLTARSAFQAAVQVDQPE